MIPGADLASWQGPPPWQLAAASISWAAVKFTEFQPGQVAYRDPDAAADWRYLRQLGKGRIAYLFGRPSTPVTATVALFAGECDALGLDDGDGIALDHEVTDGLTAAEVSLWALDVCRLLERELGRTPIVYTYLGFAWAGNCAGLGRYPLWIADPSSPPGRPRVPAPWRTWAIHQYAITGPVDRDTADWPSVPAMQATIGKPDPAPAPPRWEDDDMAITLNTGAGAETLIALADDTKHVRFYSGRQAAELRCEFSTGTAIGIRLAGTAERVAVPADDHGVTVTRLDDGHNEVSAVPLLT